MDTKQLAERIKTLRKQKLLEFRPNSIGSHHRVAVKVTTKRQTNTNADSRPTGQRSGSRYFMSEDEPEIIEKDKRKKSSDVTINPPKPEMTGY